MCLNVKNNLHGLFLRMALVSSCFMVASFVVCNGVHAAQVNSAAQSAEFGPAYVGETSVTLYPNSALVTTQIVLDRNNAEVHIVLPANADTSTFSLTSTGRRILSIEERRQKATPSPEVAKLLAVHEDCIHELALLDVDDKALDSQEAFWSKANPSAIFSGMMGNNVYDGTQAMMDSLDTMADNLRERAELLAIARHKIALQREGVQQDKLEVENRLKAINAVDFLQGAPLVPVMVVHFDANAIPDTEKARAHMYPDAQDGTGDTSEVDAAKPVMNMVNLAATYSYVVRGCGWTPTYRFEAFLDDAQKTAGAQVASSSNGEIVYDVMAEIYQKSGTSWHDVNLSLASTMPSRRMTPSALSPWHVNEYVERAPMPSPRSANAMMSKQMAPAMAYDSVMESAAAPVQQDDANFTTWNLGKQTLCSGETRTLTLNSGRLPANFYRLIRPDVEKAAYLAADVHLPQDVTMPAGKALHLVHGTILGEHYFAPQDLDMTLYFGQDPKVYATMRPRTITTGQDGVFNRKQSHTWSWDIAVHNNHAKDIPVIIEDSAPQLHHEDMELIVKSSPEPLVKTKDQGVVYTWKLIVPAQSHTDIQHELILRAPEDMALQKGR